MLSSSAYGRIPAVGLHVDHSRGSGRVERKTTAHLDLLVGDPRKPRRMRLSETRTRFRFIHGQRLLSTAMAIQLAAGAVVGENGGRCVVNGAELLGADHSRHSIANTGTGSLKPFAANSPWPANE